MAINIKFDLTGNPEPPTIILTTRNGNKLGQLDVNVESIDLNDKLNDVSEFSFTLNKYIDDKLTNLWDKVVNFKLVYCKEWDMYFEITVELDEETETIKTVFCKQLGQAELSQLKIYNMHINEDGDTNWDVNNESYKSTILYDEINQNISLLHRLLKDKAPHYSIKHVDSSIKNIQRTFYFDDKSIYDAFMEIAEEIGCLFIFHSNSGENGKIQRTISVYDLQQNCMDCGYRGEFTDICPKCGKTNIDYGYGNDTLIFVTSDELANNGIQLKTDTDAVKNCFKLKAGDDLMTATIRNCNPNGTDYIYRFSNEMKSDMSKELVEKLESYDIKYKEWYNKKIELNTDLLNKYNILVEKYDKFYNANSSICLNCGYRGNFENVCPNSECRSNNILTGNKLQKISNVIDGYSALMNAYYNIIDLSLYLESSLMPNANISQVTETTAKEQIKLLTTDALSPVAVTNINSISLATANSNILLMAKVIIKPTYKIEIESSSLSNDKKSWNGVFKITNYGDEKDTAISDSIQIELNSNEEEYVRQLIEKALNKVDTDNLSVSGLLKKEISDGNFNEYGEHIHIDKNGNVIECEFCNELKKYSLNSLLNFQQSCQTCIGILIEQGIGDNKESDLYKKLYNPYYKKLKAIEYEIKIREDEIAIIKGVCITDENNNKTLTIKGLQHYIEDTRKLIQSELDFVSYLDDLWLEFCSYRRDDTYTNDNYISDGLNNAELFKRALQFFEIAENEIYKSSESQVSISTTLKNLLIIPKFKKLIESFELGNWIRIQIDDKIYKLRLIEYGIDFGNLDDISVEFSEISKIKNGITDVKDVLEKASSMATSYTSVKRQVNQAEQNNALLTNFVEGGLNTTNTKIVNAYDEGLLLDKNGLLCRMYDPVTDTYSKEQVKIIGSTIAITDNDWETTKTAIGKYVYKDYETNEEKFAYGIIADTIVGRLLVGENLIISNNNNRLIFDDNGLVVYGKDNSAVQIQPNENSIFNIRDNNGKHVLYLDSVSGDLTIRGNIISTKLEIENYDGSVSNLSNVAISGSYKDLIDEPTKLSEFENDVKYLKNENLSDSINMALTQAKESGEFDGVSVTHSWDGTILTITSASGTSSVDLKGENGNTPIRGIDYWTNDDKTEMVNAVINELRTQGIIN